MRESELRHVHLITETGPVLCKILKSDYKMVFKTIQLMSFDQLKHIKLDDDDDQMIAST